MSGHGWTPVRAGDPDAVAQARLALHHAAQVASALGATAIPADDAHQYANLGWSDVHGALLGREVDGLQAGLRLGAAQWILVRGDGVLAELPVAGHTMAEGLAWLTERVARTGGPGGPLAPVGYEIPDHPVANGAAFEDLDPAACTVVEDWYRASAGALRVVAAAHPTAGPVRCWPHHFDIATLIDLGEGRSVNAGMTPGDGGVPEPYLYVSPWPYPSEPEKRQLPCGRWVQEGWFGAVLRASELPADQVRSVAGFFETAVDAAIAVAGA